MNPCYCTFNSPADGSGVESLHDDLKLSQAVLFSFLYASAAALRAPLNVRQATSIADLRSLASVLTQAALNAVARTWYAVVMDALNFAKAVCNAVSRVATSTPVHMLILVIFPRRCVCVDLASLKLALAWFTRSRRVGRLELLEDGTDEA